MKSYTLGTIARAGAWGALIGGVTGFTLGLLVAPEEGHKIRRRLVYQLERLGEQIGTLVEQVLSPETGSEARRTAEALVEEARTEAKRIQSDIDALLAEMRRQSENN
jgi:gas vesicle protein